MDTVNTITGSIQIGWSEENGISRTHWEFLFDAGKTNSARFCYFGESWTLMNIPSESAYEADDRKQC